MEQWAAGQFQVPDPQECAIANQGALSQCKLLERLIDQDYEQFTETFDDEEYIRPAPKGPGGSGGTG